jgi:biopolymer transport protein ExbB/biopolymer transport protein TolQ
MPGKNEADQESVSRVLSQSIRKSGSSQFTNSLGGTIQVILAQLAHFASHTVNSLAFFQEETVSFTPLGLWQHMGWLARCVAILLFIESIWSLAVMIDRYLYFSAARKQSREFAPKVAGALKDSKLEEAIKIADRNKKSHLAEVVTAGLQEFRASGGVASEATIESSGRALERAEAIVHAKLKRGLSVLATIGSTAPFVGLFGTVVGILNAFQQIATQKTSGIGAVAGGISEALVTTAFGLLVAIPAVMAFNYFTGRVEAFDVEMDNSSSELIDYFIKQSRR